MTRIRGEELVLRRRTWIGTAAGIVLLPTIGLFNSPGKYQELYFEVPPVSCPKDVLLFSVVVTLLLALFIAGTLFSVARHASVTFSPLVCGRKGFFPLTSICLTALAVSWCFAWTRFPWFSPYQHHTFLLLWMSYIALGNTLLYELSGTAPITRQPKQYLLSFPMSALCWWTFEYLNRFVHNWCYLGLEGFSAGEYLFLASLSFSTVLPAIWVTRELLTSFFRFSANAPREFFLISRWFAMALFILTTLSLIFLPFTPDYLFPILWISPITLALSIERLQGQEIVLTSAKIGGLISWAFAGLCCGFFWELWNFYSLNKWIYRIPFVGVAPVFEMPILGYAGYLPFGVLCGMILVSYATPPRAQ